MEIRTAPHYLKVKNRAILLVSVLTFFVSINSFSAGKCIDLITSIRTSQIETLGSLKSTFKHTNQYKVEVPHQSEIMNQCSLGTCHLHAWVSQLEQSYTAKTNKKIKISSHYLSLNHWVFKSLESLYSADTKLINVDLGASITQSARSIMMSGIIPDEAWVGSRDFSDRVVSTRLTEYIKNITAQAKWSAARQHTSEKKKSIIDAAAAEITNIFESLVGKQAEKFSYQGKEYTARSFMLEYFPNLLDSVVQLKVVSEKKTKNEAVSYGDDLDISTHTAEAVRVARQLIDQGKNVYLAYDHNSAFVDSKTGVMSISAFNLPDSAKPLLRSQRMYFNEYGSGHAVQIVGYDVDPVTNQVTRWKIKNSWGSEYGDLGYYHMYADYFNAFIRRIAFHKTASIELPKIDSVTPIQQTLF